MKRTTIMIPNDVDTRLRYEARRRGLSLAELLRQAVDAYLPAPPGTRKLEFVAIGESDRDDVSEHAEEFIAQGLMAEHGHKT